MTAKEYLKQAYRLDHRINSDLEEVAQLRGMAMSISSPAWVSVTLCEVRLKSSAPISSSSCRICCESVLWET